MANAPELSFPQACPRRLSSTFLIEDLIGDLASCHPLTLTFILSHQGRGDVAPSPLVGEGWGEGVF